MEPRDPTGNRVGYSPLAASDLVVTSDTAIAHLAGALGRPVWVALGQDCDWRWGTDRADSPWYPTMWLSRQTAFHDWHGVFAAMPAELLGVPRPESARGVIDVASHALRRLRAWHPTFRMCRSPLAN